MWKESSLLRWFLRILSKKKNVLFLPKQIKIKKELLTMRTVKYRDIKDLLSVEREVYAVDIPWNRTAFFMELSSDVPHLYLLVESTQEVIGFIGCRFESGDAHITNFAVRPRYQGAGIGTLFIAEIKTMAKQLKCHQLSLEVRLSNKDAQRLYRQLGFVSKSIKQDYYFQDKEDALDMVFLIGRKEE